MAEKTPETDLLAAIGGGEEPDELPEDETVDEVSVDEPTDETVDEPSGDEKPQTFKVKVRNAHDLEEERDLSLEELAKGYMLQADYSRKTQKLAEERQQQEMRHLKAVQDTQQSAIDQISQLQELVVKQAAPELNGVNWVELSVTDPNRFVQLQAKQQQLQGTFQALEQQKAQLAQERDKSLAQSMSALLKQSDEYLREKVPDIAKNGAQFLTDVEKQIGWTRNDLSAAAQAMAAAGLNPKVLGQVLELAHEAMQFRKLKSETPAAMKKVAEAPKVIKPVAPQPKPANKAAADRLRKFGRVTDLAAFIR